jgi:hypothetical protein
MAYDSRQDTLKHIGEVRARLVRVDDGDIRRSIYENADRFGYGDELRQILLNTVKVIP